jgi:hypothetical protein
LRTISILFVALIGIFFLLARRFYARFVISLVVQIPAIRKREKSLLDVITAASVCFGVAFILLAVLMAFNVLFPD